MSLMNVFKRILKIRVNNKWVFCGHCSGGEKQGGGKTSKDPVRK